MLNIDKKYIRGLFNAEEDEDDDEDSDFGC